MNIISHKLLNLKNNISEDITNKLPYISLEDNINSIQKNKNYNQNNNNNKENIELTTKDYPDLIDGAKIFKININDVPNTFNNNGKPLNTSITPFKVPGSNDELLSNMFLGRIYFYQILRNPKTGKYIYLIGEEHAVTQPIDNKKILSVFEFLQALTNIHKKNNEKLVILTEGLTNNVPNDINTNGLNIKKFINILNTNTNTNTNNNNSIVINPKTNNLTGDPSNNYYIDSDDDDISDYDDNDNNSKIIINEQFVKLPRRHAKDIINGFDIKSGRIHNTLFLDNAISTDLRRYLDKKFLNATQKNIREYSPKDDIIKKEYTTFIDNLAITTIKQAYSFLNDKNIKDYYNDRYNLYENSKNFKNHPIVEVVTDLLVDYFNNEIKDVNLVYYAHYGHISMAYSRIVRHYSLNPIIYSYNPKLFNGDFTHCTFTNNNNTRICDQTYLLNVNPFIIQPFNTYDNFIEVLNYYKYTARRKGLPIKSVKNN